MKFQLVSPFFDLSFGLLRSGGQFGFIVSNAFAKREFGQPLVEDFFPTVDLQKVVDCSGLMFPGHGTPTCIVFGAQRKPDEKNPIRVAALPPGGGDLRTPPEDSPVWHTLAAQHNNPGFINEKVVVSDRKRSEMSKWPWNFDVGSAPTKVAIEATGNNCLRDFLFADVGFMFVIGRNEIFMLPPDVPRRLNLGYNYFKRLNVGDEIRNFELRGTNILLFPYDPIGLKLVKFSRASNEAHYFSLFSDELSERPTFSGTFGTDGREPYQFHQLPIERAKNPKSISLAQIATHIHAIFDQTACAFNEKAPLLKLQPGASDDDHHLLSALLNSSAALFWLKQICFSKRESEEGDKDTYFEFAGGKVQQLPVPAPLAEKLTGKSHSLAERLTAISSACWKRGQELPSLALRKLFEQSGEAYAAWNAALPGHVLTNEKLPAPFATTAELRAAFNKTIAVRENLRVEMIALQEEMDWLVYRAYGLLNKKLPASAFNWSNPNELSSLKRIQESQRPFRLWAATNGDFAQACKLIPAEWDEERQKVWTARLTEIRDNEHIRRIEQPVYKRRWDEQWKVSNSWLAGPVAYAQELVDAFRWWLVEKAEWHLENKAKGGPLSLDAWSIALASDARVQAAWPVIAEAIHQVELWKIESKDKKPSKPPKADASSVALIKFFRDAVNEETVPDGIPAGVSWEELEKKMTVPKQAKNVRGKLNVPRERFRQRADGYIWAGMTK